MPTDTPRAVVRRVLAGGDWLAFADVLARVAAAPGEIDPAACQKAYDRLVRSGHKEAKTRSARLEVGRSRVVRECLQHLTHAGEVEAAGGGDARRYRLRPRGSAVQKPKPTRTYKPLDSLTFDPHLQVRVLSGGGTTDPEWVEHLRGEIREGEELDPIEVVDDAASKRLWVFAGFHRGAAYAAEGVGSVACLVYPGTYLDAKLWAIGSNPVRSLPRTAADCRNAFDSLRGDKTLWKKVTAPEFLKAHGGLHRTVQKVCGLSSGAVSVYLKEAGVGVDRQGAITYGPPVPHVPRTVRPPEPESRSRERDLPGPPPPAPAPDGDADDPGRNGTPHAGPRRPTRIEVAGDPIKVSVRSALKAIETAVGTIGRCAEEVLHTRYGHCLREAAAQLGLPLEVQKVPEPAPVHGRKDWDSDAPKVERMAEVESWPVLPALLAVCAGAAARVSGEE